MRDRIRSKPKEGIPHEKKMSLKKTSPNDAIKKIKKSGTGLRTDYLVVGAGLAGCTISERIASQLGKKVLLVEKRGHLGGNAFDYENEHGILVQKYGPHIFHTNSERVWNYLSRFTGWNGYVHRVLAMVNGKLVHLPLNLETMERLYDRSFTALEMEAFLEQRREKIAKPENARDVVVSAAGTELYELFFRNYSKKQWGLYPEELGAEVTSRLPLRFDRDTRYFTDRFQGLPDAGYTRMFERMLATGNIEILLNTDYRKILNETAYEKLIFTGPIDYFFDHMYGKLPYRSLDFEFKTLDVERFQESAVVNFPNEHEYTRITEFKHFYFQENRKTTICYEYPRADGDPFYPFPNPACREIYQKYRKEAEKLKNVFFLGRLAEYMYLNMDQVVEKALNLACLLAEEPDISGSHRTPGFFKDNISVMEK